MQPDIKNDLTYLLRILESIEKIIIYSKGYDEVIDFYFANDQKDFNASLMFFINIGEQTSRVDNILKAKHPKVPWKVMKQFRNRVAHNYAGLDNFKVFEIIKKDLPVLKIQIEEIIQAELNDKTFLLEEFLIAKESRYYQNINFGQFKS
ncbi:Uncharacterized conserved protein, contains HEPN domain [bacterium A37T11]|nr:Uncharacterized conserved protein, contains HEPN domain [bacterium A37T11]